MDSTDDTRFAMQVTCSTCLRCEERTTEGVTVLDEGGQRRPATPVELSAWQVLREIAARGQVCAGPCEACGMPLHTEQGSAEPWTFELPNGALVIHGPEITLGDSAVSADRAESMIREAFERPASLAQRLFEGAMVTWLVVPFLIWICAMFCFGAFLCIGVPQGAEFMPR